MCGIVGYIGEKPAKNTIVECISNLEYRGYDSAGIAICSSDKTLHVAKGVGTIDKVLNRFKSYSLNGTIGIGHTRWATHGKVTDDNAHPHTDCTLKIAIVHNGTINNYMELKWGLIHKGHFFTSETDSEVIAHLIEEEMKTAPFEVAFKSAIKRLSGNMAILAVCSDEPDTLIAYKVGSPLVIGSVRESNEFILASDAISFAKLTNYVTFLEDGDIVVIRDNGKKIDRTNVSGKSNSLEFVEIEWDENFWDKGKYAHYMLAEIMNQPLTLANSLEKHTDNIDDIKKVATLIKNAKHVIFVACGTSRYASIIGRYLFSTVGKVMSEVIMASEFKYFCNSIDENTLIIAVSQSGETADVTMSINSAKAHGAKVISIVNVPGSSLERKSDYVFYLFCGPEVSVAATKTYTSELVVLYLISAALADKTKIMTQKLMHLPVRIEDSIYDNIQKISVVTCELEKSEHIYYLARGINFATAGEAALKMKEISYIHAEGMPAGELKHGTLSLVTDNTPVVGICPFDNTYMDMLTNLHEVKSRGAKIIAVTNEPDRLFDYTLSIPNVDPIFYPLVCIIPTQLLAYQTAISKGLNPDRPRNLAKSCTVE